MLIVHHCVTLVIFFTLIHCNSGDELIENDPINGVGLGGNMTIAEY